MAPPNSTIDSVAFAEQLIAEGVISRATFDRLANEESEKLKNAADLFSGASDNRERAFILYNEALAGIGHTNSAFSQDSKEQKKQKKEKEQKAQAAKVLLDIIETTRQTQEIISKAIARHQASIKQIETIQKQIQDEKQHFCDELEKKEKNGDITAPERQEIEEELDQKIEEADLYLKKATELEQQNISMQNEIFSKMDNLPVEVQKLFNESMEIGTQLVTIPLQIEGVTQQHHIVHQNEDGQYFITHPETGQAIFITDEAAQAAIKASPDGKLGNKAPKLAEKFNQNYLDAISKGRKLGYGENIKEIAQLITNIRQNDIAIKIHKDQAEKFKKTLQDLRAEIKDLSPQEIKEKIKHSGHELKALEDSIKETAKTLSKNTDKLEQRTGKLDDLLKELKKAQQVQENIKDVHAVTSKFIGEFENRHDQLEDKYLGKMLTWASAIIPVNETTSWLYATTFSNSELAQAWKNPISHNGQGVYQDNETAELYTYTEEGGRKYIKDPEVLTELYKQAYQDKKFFVNETPQMNDDEVRDPNNTYAMTSEAMLDRKKALETTTKTTVEASEENYQKIKQRYQEEKERAQAQQNTTPPLKNDFTASAVPQADKKPDSEYINAFNTLVTAKPDAQTPASQPENNTPSKTHHFEEQRII